MGFGEYLPKQKTEYTVKTEPVQMQPQQADGNAFPITEEVRTDEKVKQAEPITETRWGFQHRSDPKSPQPKYGKRAKRTVDLIKRAQLEHTPITASTTSARIGNHDGLNGEMVENGISHSHTYMVDGYVEKEDGHIFIKLVNPWGIDVPQYGIVTEVDGRTHQTTVMNQDASTEGNFELE